MGHWKGVCRPWGGPVELFDLQADVGERQNVAGSHPDVVAKVRAVLKEAHEPSPLWKVRDAKQR